MEVSENKKIIVGIASIPNRVEGLRYTIKGLSPQVDHIYVWLNGYKKIPEISEENVTFHLSEVNEGALAKLKILSLIEEKSFYYFTCDDDIIYPKDYISHNLKHYTPETIQSSHAKIFPKFPITDYAFGDISGYYFGSNIEKKSLVHVVGTGVCLMDSNIALKIEYNSFTTTNMLDVWVSCWAHINEIPMYVLPHPQNWLIPNSNVTQIDSIWEQTKNSDEAQITIINHYFS